MSPTTYLPTYRAIAEQLDIPWCRGILPTGQRCFARHRPGSTAHGGVHFANRRESRAGIRLFLFLGAKLIEDQLAEQAGGEDEWRRHYRANRRVTNWIKTIRVEMPRDVTARYKTALKAMLAAVEPGDPEREEAWLWASR